MLVGLAVPDLCVKFPDPRLNRSLEIQPKAIGGGIFDNVLNDIVSSVALELVSADVDVKFGDSRSNHSRDVRAAHSVMGDAGPQTL